MSSLFEQMIHAAVDVQRQSSSSNNSTQAASKTSTTSPDESLTAQASKRDPFNFSSMLDDYPAHVFPSQLASVIPSGCRFPQYQTTMPASMTSNDNQGCLEVSPMEPNATATKGSAAEMGSTSSGATAITILTPEPTESATSSVGGSPRSVCSTLTSEQITDHQLQQVDQETAEKSITCSECGNYYNGVTRQPKILDCIHTFCEPCLVGRQIPFSSNPPHLSITCPLAECEQVTVVSTVSALQTNIPALTMSLVARAIQHLTVPAICNCLLNQEVSYLCFSCHQLICQNCAASTHPPPQHNIESLDGLNLNTIDAACVSGLVDRLRNSRSINPSAMTVMCPRHPALPVFSYCETCSQPVCQDCTPQHFSTKVGDHVTIHLLKNFDAQTYKHECGFFAAYIKHIRETVMLLRSSLDTVQRSQASLHQQHMDSNAAVLNTFDLYNQKTANLQKLYGEQSDELLQGLALGGGLEKIMTDVDQLREETIRLNMLFERARENCSAAEMSSLREWVRKKVIEIRQRCKTINQSVNLKRRHSLPLDVRPLIENEFHKVFDPRLENRGVGPYGGSSVLNNTTSMHGGSASYGRYNPAISASTQSHLANAASRFGPAPNMPRSAAEFFQQQQSVGGQGGWQNATNQTNYQRMLSILAANSQQHVSKQPGMNASGRPGSAYFGKSYPIHPTQLLDMRQNLTPGSTYTPSSSNATTPTYEALNSRGQLDDADDSEQQMVEQAIVTDSPLIMNPSSTSLAIPNRLQLRYIAKIGQFGEADGQFTEPSGIATNLQNQLVVADTNSHRIQVFNNHGAFLWRFGECGKRAGQVLYPNRIAIGPEGEYVFTERAPQCLVQVFDSQGTFIRRFGSGDLRHPRGLCIDPEGHVLVLECQVMSVTIYDMRGVRLRRFNFEGIRFPSSICVNDQQEIFIADNIQHFVYVYNYEGVMKRRIGGYPTINFPVGVAINHQGHLVVADNHNNFNITVFTQDGTPISGYESCVKHAQVLDVCLLNAGRAVAISCKDYRVYVYPYQDCTAASMLDGPVAEVA